MYSLLSILLQTQAASDGSTAWGFLVLALLLPLGLLCGAVALAAIVFALFYAFSYKKLKVWFDGKCGVECIPDQRLNRRLKSPLMAIVLMALFNILAQAVVPMAEGNVPLQAVLVVLAIVVVVGAPFYVLRRAYLKDKELYGKKAARWLMVYGLLSIYAIYLICVVAVYLVLIVAGLYLATFVLKQTGAGGALDIANRSCANCTKAGTTQCPFNKKSSDSGCCDSHSM
ncbi:MAG: hypothetical protein ACI4UC_07210 [Alloprevotella sp.]